MARGLKRGALLLLCMSVLGVCGSLSAAASKRLEAPVSALYQTATTETSLSLDGSRMCLRRPRLSRQARPTRIPISPTHWVS